LIQQTPEFVLSPSSLVKTPQQQMIPPQTLAMQLLNVSALHGVFLLKSLTKAISLVVTLCAEATLTAPFTIVGSPS
jgi:hypothetical protein